MALLERDGRNVRLNAAARRLVVRADRVLAELDAAESELAAEHGGVRGEVVIGAFPSAAAHLVVPAVQALHARHPELRCLVREHEPEDGIPLLRSGELDLLISESYDDVSPAPAGGLERHALLDGAAAAGQRHAARAARRPAHAGRRAVDRRHRAVRGRARARLPGRGLHAPDRPPRRRGHGLPGAGRRRAGRRAAARPGLLARARRALRARRRPSRRAATSPRCCDAGRPRAPRWPRCWRRSLPV